MKCSVNIRINLFCRNYHVFYYLLAGANEVESKEFHLGKPEDYMYLNKVCKSYFLPKNFKLHFDQRAYCIMDRILKKVELGNFITTALKSILKLVKLQSLVAKCCKMRKI